MTHDVRQWLGEIKSLQQKLAEAHQERDEAYASAANWRKLYETEAQQRRTEANLSKQSQEQLKAEIQRLQGFALGVSGNGDMPPEIRQRVEQIQAPDELRQALMQVMIECDRLTKALKHEQAEHNQTRKSLTSALGDTMDLLTKERNQSATHSADPIKAQSEAVTAPAAAKSPSLELPTLDQAQSLI